MSRAAWVVSGVLLAALIGLGIGLRWLGGRASFDQDLLTELASAGLVEDPAPEAADWPQWRGPARDGVVTFPRLKRDWDGLAATHKLPGGDGYSSFAVRGDTAWTMGEQDGEEVFFALDLAAGKEKWRYAYPAPRFDYGGPRATPAVDGDDVFTLSSDGTALSLKADDGSVNWKKPLGLSPPKWGFAWSPLVEGGLVHLGPVALDRKTGEKRWERKESVGYSSPVLATVGGVRQVICFTGTHLLGLRADTGDELWRFGWDTPFQVNAATPLVIRAEKGKDEYAYVFISSGYGKGCALVRVTNDGGTFAAKSVYESSELCCHFASPVRRGEHVYALDETRDLTCLALRTGKVLWRQRGFNKGSLIRIDDGLLILGENGNLALAEASPDGYSELTKARPFRDRCWALPALANGRLLIRDRKTIQVLDVGK